MNDIYELKARKYKYKYLKLKKEIEYIGEGGDLVGRLFNTKKYQLKEEEKTKKLITDEYYKLRAQEEAEARERARVQDEAEAQQRAKE